MRKELLLILILPLGVNCKGTGAQEARQASLSVRVAGFVKAEGIT